MPGESLMDIELSDSYIHCEYFLLLEEKLRACSLPYIGKNLVFFDYQGLYYSSDSISLFKYLFIGLYYSGAVVAVIRDLPEAAANVWCGCRGKLHCLHILEHL